MARAAATAFACLRSTKRNPKNIKGPKLDSLLYSIPKTRNPAERTKLQLEAAVLSKNQYTVTSILGTHNILALDKKVGDIAQRFFVYKISGLMFETTAHPK